MNQQLGVYLGCVILPRQRVIGIVCWCRDEDNVIGFDVTKSQVTKICAVVDLFAISVGSVVGHDELLLESRIVSEACPEKI